jgi:hypothetical protein
MGGFGSGRYEYADTPTVEESRTLDVDALKELSEHPGSGGKVWWGDREDPEANIRVLAEGSTTAGGEERAAQLRLKYTVTNTRTDEQTEYDYTIPLEYTECHFGGARPCFRCPKCDTRRRKLYLPPGGERYLCRECYDLGYYSSRTSGDDLKQAELRYRRAFAKADAEGRSRHPESVERPILPERPKEMHHDTFEDLLEDVREAREEWSRVHMEQLRELASGAGVSPPTPLEE